jgi:cytochrome P450
MAAPADDREASKFFLNVPQKLDNPFPDLKYFRENRPVFYYLPLNSWFIFRYDDVLALFHDARLSADRMKGFVDAAPAEVRPDLRKIAPYLEMWMMMNDGQDHTRMRQFMHLGFSNDRIAALRIVIQSCVDELLDKVQNAGHMDACGDLGFLLPAYVLSDLLGVHREDRGRIIQWSVDFVDFFNVVPINIQTTRRLVASGFAMIEYTRGLIAERRAQPKDDFLGTLVSAGAKQGGFAEDEIVSNAMLLLLAGHVAVRNLIGNVLYLLLQYPDQLAMVIADLQLLPTAIDEALRFETPVTMIPRIALEDFEFHGQTIRKGQIVQLSLASANRDAAHFSDPENFDIARKPGKYLSFGDGPHGCLGAALAKEQANLALATLFRRMPKLRLDESKPIQWYRNAGNRGPITLPLVFG